MHMKDGAAVSMAGGDPVAPVVPPGARPRPSARKVAHRPKQLTASGIRTAEEAWPCSVPGGSVQFRGNANQTRYSQTARSRTGKLHLSPIRTTPVGGTQPADPPGGPTSARTVRPAGTASRGDQDPSPRLPRALPTERGWQEPGKQGPHGQGRTKAETQSKPHACIRHIMRRAEPETWQVS